MDNNLVINSIKCSYRLPYCWSELEIIIKTTKNKDEDYLIIIIAPKREIRSFTTEHNNITILFYGQEMSDLGQCELCKEAATQKCSQCKLVYYCSIQHQKENWKDHKKNCSCYEIRSNKDLGRYLVAKRDLEPGDVIFVETPLVVGPRPYKIEEGPFACVGCGKVLTENICTCADCGWPTCKPDCPGLKIPTIHGLECQILKLRPMKPEQSPYDNYRFDTLIILRALFLQKINKKKWDNLLALEDHLDDRGPKNEVFKRVQEQVNYIQENFINPLKLYEKETDQTILPNVSVDIMHKIYGTLDVNATELTDPADLFVLYPTASLLEHNCIPNSVQIIDEKDGFKITFRAALPIKKGEHIKSTYTNILWGTQERERHLKESKYFVCVCDRCVDPTELGTNFSGLICMGTEEQPCKGTQLPIKPTEEDSDWLCNKCGIKLPNKEISNFVNHLRKEVDKEIEKKPQLEDMEEFLNKLEVFLHPNHFLVYTIKHSLVQLYQVDGDIEISTNFLNAKLKMCNELIEITKKLDPGNCRLALYLAVLLNEKFQSQFKFLARNFDPDEKDSCKQLIEGIRVIFDDNIKVLENEKHNESGDKLLKVAIVNGMRFNRWLEENSVKIE